jgi:type I restriction enzyme S subunit
MAGIAEQLRQAVLQAAIQGNLTEQLPEDGDARELLADIQAEKAELIAEKKIKKEKPSEPISDDEIPFDIPDNWILVKLSEIAFVTKLAGFEYTKEIAPNLTKSGIPLFKGKNIQNGHTVYKFESYIPKEVSESLPRSQLTKPCLLTPYVGTIGNISIFDAHIPAHLGSNVGKIEPFNNKNENVNLNYLLYYMLSPFGIQQLGKHKKKNAQESTSIDAIRDCFVYLPPLAEQHRLVARVDELMAKIDELEKVENELNALHKAFPGDMKAALLQAAMQGKLTEQLPEDGNAEDLKNQILNERKSAGKCKSTDTISDEDIASIPSNWQVLRTENVLALTDGEKVTDVQLPYLEAKYLRGKVAATIKEDGKRVVAGQYLILVDGENSGEVFLAPEEGIMGSTFKVLFIPKCVSASFVQYFLKMNQSLLRENKKGAAIPHLNKDVFRNMLFPIPPLAEQQRIVEKLDKLLPLCDSLEEKL